jgi:hypothetical protein
MMVAVHLGGTAAYPMPMKPERMCAGANIVKLGEERLKEGSRCTALSFEFERPSSPVISVEMKMTSGSVRCVAAATKHA